MVGQMVRSPARCRQLARLPCSAPLAAAAAAACALSLLTGSGCRVTTTGAASTRACPRAPLHRSRPCRTLPWQLSSREHPHGQLPQQRLASWRPDCALAGLPPATRSQHYARSCVGPLRGEADDSTTSTESFYEVLGVPADANATVIKAAYRQAARFSHPDLVRTQEEKEAAQARFDEVRRAYMVLNDPAKRQAYDLRGLAGLAEFEFDGERIIMPPPWRVLVGHTGHHFWKRQEYFVGLMFEEFHLAPSEIKACFLEATKDPEGVGQAVLVKKCTERKAKDIVEKLSEFGLAAMAEEIEEDSPDLM